MSARTLLAALANATVPQPLVVSLQPGVHGQQLGVDVAVDVAVDGWAKAGLMFNALNFAATVLIAVVIFCLGNRQERRSRLQQHTAALAGSDGLNTVGEFRQQCEQLPEGYGKMGGMWRLRQPVSVGGTHVTCDDFRRVDRARKELQAVWDNIKADFIHNRLPRPITHEENSGLLKRGINYLQAVESLEAANYARMQDNDHNAPPDKPYMVWDDANANAQLSRTEPPDIKFNMGVCPSRFRWLEDQKTASVLEAAERKAIKTWRHKLLWLLRKLKLRLVPQPSLWSECELEVEVAPGVTPKLQVAKVQKETWEQLGKSEDGQEWQEQRFKHWKAVWAAYQGPRAQEVQAAHKPLVDDRELLARLVELLQTAANARSDPGQALMLPPLAALIVPP